MFRVPKKYLSSILCGCLIASSVCLVYADAQQVGSVKADVLNVRKLPNSSSNIITILKKDTKVNIKGSSEGWYNISYNNSEGWASSEFITVSTGGAENGTIIGNEVNVRSGCSVSMPVLCTLNAGTTVEVLERSVYWYKVKLANGIIGWVYKDFMQMGIVKIDRGSKTAISNNTGKGKSKISSNKSSISNTYADAKPSYVAGNGSGFASQNAVQYAQKFLGVRYVYGGSTPKGFDCSGFVKYVYANQGVGLDRVAAGQARYGVKVNRSDLKAGDLVFFNTGGGGGYINHVGIYMGGGSFIHASSGRSTHRVVVSSLNEPFYNRAFITGRRVAQ